MSNRFDAFSKEEREIIIFGLLQIIEGENPLSNSATLIFMDLMVEADPEEKFSNCVKAREMTKKMVKNKGLNINDSLSYLM